MPRLEDEYPHSHETNMQGELARLLLLQSYATLPREAECLDRLTRMVARVLCVDMCFLNLVDCNKSGVIGCSNKNRIRRMSPCPCKGTICAYAMHHCRNGEAFTVEDATKDERFQSLDVVKTKMIMFYAAVPISLEGFMIGVLCLVHSRPRALTEKDKTLLRDFATIAVQYLARLRQNKTGQRHDQQNVAHLTHDLMTPLTGLQLSLNLLESDYDFQRKPKVRETTKAVKCCCDTIKKFYHESMESIASLQLEPPGKEACLKLPLDNLIKSLSKIMSTIPKQVPLIFEMDSSSPSSIESECCAVVFRAALNLLTIATARTQVGFVKLLISGNSKNHVKFQCIDCADNVAKDDSKKVFVSRYPQDFHDQSLAKYYFPAKLLSNLCGSNHGFSPRIGAFGSIFWFSVPCQIDRNRTIAASIGMPQSLASDHDSTFDSELIKTKRQRCHLNDNGECVSRMRRALVVDDSIVIRKSIGRSLCALGFEVEVAENGLEGLEKLKGGVFDIVLCDFLMPVLDGLDCVRQFRDWEAKNRPNFHQYIVGISAHASMHDYQIGMECGMDHYLCKPITVEALKNLDSNHPTTRITLQRISIVQSSQGILNI